MQTLQFLGYRYSIQGLEVHHHELAEPDGFLPALIYVTEIMWCQEFGGRVRMALRRDETALLDVVTEFPSDGAFSVAWFQHALTWRLTELADQSASMVKLDELYCQLHKAVGAGECEVR